MRIGIISTYPPVECGIATYTSYLVEQLRKIKNEVYIVTQHGGSGQNVYPIFNARDGNLAEEIYEMTIKFTPDIIHIQHEYGLYGDHRGVNIIPLLYMFKMSRIPVVVTLHTVYEEFTRDQHLITEAILRVCDAAIVHEQAQQQSIETNIGNACDIHVIPHGSRLVEPIPDAKAKLGVQGKKVILICGYFRPTKGYHHIVKLFPDIVRRVPDSVLLVAGKTRLQEYSAYRNEFFNAINTSPARSQIKVLRGQFPQKTFDTILSAADVVPLPYQHSGQSGVAAHCLAFGKPLVTSPITSFRSLIERAQCGFVADTDDEFVERIVEILTNDELRNHFSSNALRYVRENVSWQIIAKRTVDVYHSIVSVPYGGAEYMEL